ASHLARVRAARAAPARGLRPAARGGLVDARGGRRHRGRDRQRQASSVPRHPPPADGARGPRRGTMSRHLTDRTLLETLEEKGSSPEQEHLRSCVACAARRASLADDLEVLSSVLRDGPLPRPVARPVAVRRWVSLAGAAAAAAALAWGVSGRSPVPEQM